MKIARKESVYVLKEVILMKKPLNVFLVMMLVKYAMTIQMTVLNVLNFIIIMVKYANANGIT